MKEVFTQVCLNFDLKCEKVTHKVMHKAMCSSQLFLSLHISYLHISLCVFSLL